MKQNLEILDKYIGRQVWVGFAIVLTILMGIAWFSQIIRLIGYIVNKNASFLSFLKMTSLLLPDLVLIVAPVAMFISVLFIYNKLVVDKEMLIMQGSGISPKRLAKPAMKCAFQLVGAAYVMMLWLGPIFSKKYRDFVFNLGNDVSSILVKEGEFNPISRGITIYVKGARENIMHDVFIDDRRVSGAERTIIAEKGKIDATKQNIVLSLENGSVWEAKNDQYTFGKFKYYSADLGITNSESTRTPRIWELSTAHLVENIDDEKNVIELNRRLTDPLYIFIFVMTAVVCILKGKMNRRGGSRAPLAAVAITVAIRLGQVVMSNIMQSQKYGYIISDVFIAVCLAALYYSLYLSKRAK